MSFDTMLDQAEVEMNQMCGVMGMVKIDPLTTHHFIPGFYIRQITMPEGFMCTTKVHGKRHPFVVSRGRVWVKSEENEEAQLIEGPYVGVTEPGTRRILICETETVWTTMHETEQMNLDKLIPSIEEEVMLQREHPVPIADSLNRQTAALHD